MIENPNSRRPCPEGWDEIKISGAEKWRSSSWLAIACALLVPGLASGAPKDREAAHTGVQDFLEEAPADVEPGAFVMYGQVVHRAVDGAWIMIRAESHWGRFTYLLTNVGRETADVGVADRMPAAPAGAALGRDMAWSDVRAEPSAPRIRLEGRIVAARAEGAELEGVFQFKGELLRLHMKLIESFPLGADPMPTWRNVFYGADFRQKLDLYLARSSSPGPAVIYIHGGGWVQGDKSSVAGYGALLAAGISVISIDYRYLPEGAQKSIFPPVSLPLADAALAMQYVRSRAAEWGIDKSRIGVWGISAGACSALWLGTHPDQANPAASDPVLRESTRPACVVAIMAQTSLDPTEMQAWVGPELNYGPAAFAITATVPGDRAFDAFVQARERLLPWIAIYSPAALLSSDDSPMFLDYLHFSLTPNEPLNAYYTHSPRFGIGFADRAKAVGAECHLRYAGHEDPTYPGWKSFLIEMLTHTNPLHIRP